MKTYPLSNAQIRIWYIQKKYKDSPLFNIGGTVQVNGTVDVDILKEAIISEIRQNAIMSMQFMENENQVYQYISSQKIEIDFMDFSLESDSYGRFLNWCHEQAEKPFEMLDCPLYYFSIYKIEESVMGYFVKVHHLIADGWSFKLMTEHIKNKYEDIIHGIPIDTTTSVSYIDYLQQEQAYIGSRDMTEDKLYWNDMFLDFESISSRVSNQLKGERLIFQLEPSLRESIDGFLKKMGITLNIFFTAIYILYEYKKYGKDDVVIGLPLLGRSGKKEYQTIGNFTNTMPYRCKINRDESIAEFLLRLCIEMRDIYRHQKYPYNKLYKDLNQNEYSTGKLYNVCINEYHTTLPRSMDGYQCQNTEFYCGEQDYGLQIIIRQWVEGTYELDYDYQKSLYSRQAIEQMHSQLLTLIDQVMDRVNQRVNEICILNCADRHRYLEEFNLTDQKLPNVNTWLELFNQIVEKRPNEIAISIYGKNESMTYHELDELSNVVANNLEVIGVKKGTRIVIIPEYDMKSIVVILAIMKCGGIYVPMDKEAPISRVEQIIYHSRASFYIAKKEKNHINCQFLNMNQLFMQKTEKSHGCAIGKSDVAYMIYTSGSTGTPKGVLITHENLLNYLWWAKNIYIISKHEVFALYSSFAFDFTITSILLPLISSGEIRIFQDFHKHNIFTEIMKDGAVTIVKITPSMIQLIDDVNQINSKIHTFIVGGENLYREDCYNLHQKFRGNVLIYNEYGPTEATIGCMIYLYQQDMIESIPIGKPIANTYIYLLDSDMQPVPDDTIGEIYIGGAGVAAGYDHNEVATQERFLKNPFRPNQRMYKTGDMAYRKSTGDLVYVGRDDEEIKIRGYRVNLCEIEKKIREINYIKDAVVSVVIREDGTHQLCAYYIGDASKEIERLKNKLKESLPSYMVPDFFSPLKSYPLTLNGKVDKRRLPSPQYQTIETNYQESNYEQIALMDVVRNVFRNPNIAIENNFYEIGGDSIKAIQISSHLMEQGFELSVRDILENTYLWKIARCIKVREAKITDSVVYDGDVDHLPIIDWFINQKFIEEGHYNQSILLELRKEINYDTLNQVFILLLKQHDALRLNMRQDKSLFYNNEHLKTKVILQTVDFSDDKNSDINDLVIEKLEHLFDLRHDLLIWPCLIRKGEKQYLYITAHHLIMDGVSLRILLEDLFSLIEQLMNGETVKLKEKTVSYQTFAKEYEQWAGQISLDEWYLQQLEESNGNNWMKIEGSKESNYTGIECRQFESEITKDFLSRANKPFHTKPSELLFIALVRAVHEVVKVNDILIENEEHGRNLIENMNVNHTIGWFTNLYPIRVLIENEELYEQIKQIKDTMRNTSKIGFQYGIAKYKTKKNVKEYNRLCLNYHGVVDTTMNKFFQLKKVIFDCDSSRKNHCTAAFEINAFIIENKLHLYFKYNQSQELFKRLSLQYEKEIVNLVTYCCSLQHDVYTPSDFDMVNLNDNEIEQLTKELFLE